MPFRSIRPVVSVHMRVNEQNGHHENTDQLEHGLCFLPSRRSQCRRVLKAGMLHCRDFFHFYQAKMQLCLPARGCYAVMPSFGTLLQRGDPVMLLRSRCHHFPSDDVCRREVPQYRRSVSPRSRLAHGCRRRFVSMSQRSLRRRRSGPGQFQLPSPRDAAFFVLNKGRSVRYVGEVMQQQDSIPSRELIPV